MLLYPWPRRDRASQSPGFSPGKIDGGPKTPLRENIFTARNAGNGIQSRKLPHKAGVHGAATVALNSHSPHPVSPDPPRFSAISASYPSPTGADCGAELLKVSSLLAKKV